MTAPSRRARALAVSVLTLAAASGVAGLQAARGAGGAVAIIQAPYQAASRLEVSIPDVAPGGALPLGYTADGRNISPPLSWSAGPHGVKSYLVLVQDPDAPPAAPLIHWLIWNIPPDVTSLPRAMHNVDSPTTPLGSAQAQNFHGSLGYTGPRPAPGDAPHHYHFQVFALDRMLKVRPGSQPPAVLAAMAGHVRASGELVATFAAPTPKSPKTATAPGV
jgi:Raf kinase inhibitor-like YbhB/YbcL family protein